MKFKFSSHGSLRNNRRDIQISMPPFEADSDEYLGWIRFLENRSNEDQTFNYLNLEAKLTMTGGRFTPKNKIRNYQLNAIEISNLRHLIKNIKIVNFNDDLESLHVCDGGSFSIDIESPNVIFSFSQTNVFNGITITGLHELIEAIEIIEKSKI